ncbi:MAG: prepilin-type N-terminal cleavage/methylation domain-containing protein [Opitutaceae bacterium]|jgi:general secretion pathway protein G
MNFSPSSPGARSSTGFTLIELLTVIAIVGILIAIMFPVIGTMRERAHDSKCKSNLRQLVTAYLLYAQDNRGKVVTDELRKENETDPPDPPPSSWPQKLDPYINRVFTTKLYEIYKCPSLPEDPTRLWYNADYSANMHGAVYGWWVGFRKAPTMLSAIANPGRVFAFADWVPAKRFAQKADFWMLEDAQYKDSTFRHNGKINAVFVDGHIGQFTSPFPTDINTAPWN